MKIDFFTFSRHTIAQTTAEARFDMAYNRTAAVRCLQQFCGKDELSFDELSTDFIAQFKRWIIANGRKETTVRLNINQSSAVYTAAAKAGLVSVRRKRSLIATSVRCARIWAMPSSILLYDVTCRSSRPCTW